MINFQLYAKPKKIPDRFRYHMHDTEGLGIISSALSTHLKNCASDRAIVFLCIGTDRSTGDSLGPLVGSQLSEYTELCLYVYGTLENPVHAVNLHQTLHDIHITYTNPFIVAIDACLGKTDNIGFITLAKGALRPGAGVNKNLPNVGEVHLTGIVNVAGFMEYLVLQNTRLSVVINLAKAIADISITAYQSALQKQINILC